MVHLPIKFCNDPLKDSDLSENLSTLLGMLGPLAKYFLTPPENVFMTPLPPKKTLFSARTYVYEQTLTSWYLEIWVFGEGFLQVPAEPAWVEHPEEEADEEVAPEGGHDGEDEVHDGQLHQLLSEHGLPAQLSQLQLLSQVVVVLVGHRGTVVQRGAGNHRSLLGSRRVFRWREEVSPPTHQLCATSLVQRHVIHCCHLAYWRVISLTNGFACRLALVVSLVINRVISLTAN